MIGTNKLIILITVILSAVIFVSGCNAPTISNNETKGNDELTSEMPEETEDTMAVYKRITPKEAYNMMNQEEVIILDVRTKQEYEQGHIENSILLPVDEIKSKAESVLPDKDAVILVYCRSGNRSYHASVSLIELGYTNVLDFGGIISWPYEIVA